MRVNLSVLPVLLALLFLSFVRPALAETDKAVWVTKRVEVALGEGMTMQDVKDMARRRARDRAVEEAVGSFIIGSTVVHNYQVVEDIAASLRRGVVVAEEVLDSGFTATDSGSPVYHITLKAKVRPVPVEKRGGLSVTLSMNRSVFTEGEEVEIRVKASKDSYVYVFDVFADDMVTLLVPNRYMGENRLKRGTELVFPGALLSGRGISLKTQLPPGTGKAVERVKVIVSTEKIDFFDTRVKEAVFSEFDGMSSTLIHDIYRTLALRDPATWAEATAVYEIRR